MPTPVEELQVAIAHHQAGRLAEAEVLYRRILQVQPKEPDAIHLLGVIAIQTGKHHAAAELISQAISLNPAAPEYHNSLGEAYRVLGRASEAAAHYSQALSLKPNYAEAHSNLGVLLASQGRVEDAAASCRRAVLLKPAFSEAHHNLGIALQALGDLPGALASFERAVSLKPAYLDALTRLALVRYALGQRHEALQILFDALTANPESAQLRRALATVLQGYTLHRASESVRTILLSLCHDDSISMHNVSTAVIGLVEHSAGFAAVVDCERRGENPFASAGYEADSLMTDPLLLAALPRMVVSDPLLEKVLTYLRRWITLASRLNLPPRFLAALARQCFNTQYAWRVATDESRRIARLRRSVETLLAGSAIAPRKLEPSLQLISLYAPLHSLKNWQRLLDPDTSTWSESFQPIVREQLIDKKREDELAAGVAALTQIRHPTSRKVRQQYEESPYPRWLVLQRPAPMTAQSLFFSLRPGEPAPELPHRPSILIAGCGTGQHPIQVAMAFADCDVLAVDLSRASLGYAARMAERYGVGNIRFQQADVLELGDLNQRFTIVECGGVLHHLEDPLQGWRAITAVLAPDGLMKIGLYSRTARRHIQAARDFVRERDLGSSADDVRKVRDALMSLPENDPIRTVLHSVDFYSISGCRDLIMHVQERQFTIEEIADCLDQLGLRFLGFQCDSQVLVRFQSMFPEPDARRDLNCWSRFEEANPDTFLSMYQFWCCRKRAVNGNPG